jgi:hypothetical protein
MPTLDLGNWLDIFDLSSPIRLLAAMAHPNEPDKQKRIIASCIGGNKERLLEKHKSLVQKEIIRPSDKKEWEKLCRDTLRKLDKHLSNAYNSSGGIKTIIDSPDLKQIMKKYGEACYRGIIAGHMLFAIKQMKDQEQDIESMGGGSVNKAVDLICITNKIVAEKLGIGISPTSIRKYWAEYKPVSHLWAAYKMWGVAGCPDECSPHHCSSLPIFLTLGDEFRKFGESYSSHGQDGPLLSKNETCRPPANIPLYEVSFDLPLLTPAELKILNDYRPPMPLK